MRRDIQFLRAIAVTAVIVFHLDPRWLHGGFVGVDIFFVISGFLITTHLLRRVPTTGRDLGAFWARRIRRLLPASLFVLLVTLIAVHLWAPNTQIPDITGSIIASALYVSNWFFAATSVNYLAEDNAPSPAQHYWSLSVEEQFYLVWPVLVFVLAVVVYRWMLHRRIDADGKRDRAWPVIVACGLGLVVVASFVYSVWEVGTNPQVSYFDTLGRAWEFGLGGLIAVANLWSPLERLPERYQARLRSVLAWIGIVGVIAACVLMTGSMPFPGLLALWPVAATALVIWADAPRRLPSPVWFGAWRPIQWLGDVSYSAYLWHWPLIVLAPYILNHALNLPIRLGIVVAALLLSWGSKYWIEDRFRARRPGLKGPAAKTPARPERLRGAYALMCGGMALVVLAAGGGLLALQSSFSAQRATAATLSNRDCFGAAAMNDSCEFATRSGTVAPIAIDAKTDRSKAYDNGCLLYPPFKRVVTCTYGDKTGSINVALVGNSHATHLLPTLDVIAKQRGWKITTYFASQCTVSTTPANFPTTEATRGCLRWSRDVLKATSGKKYDLVLASQRSWTLSAQRSIGKPVPIDDSLNLWKAGYQDVLKSWAAASTPLVVIHDTPDPGATLTNVPDCVARHTQNYLSCSGPRSVWDREDPFADTATALGMRDVVSINDAMCDAKRCYSVIGNVIVYFDASHLTRTFSQTLAPLLSTRIKAIRPDVF